MYRITFRSPTLQREALLKRDKTKATSLCRTMATRTFSTTMTLMTAMRRFGGRSLQLLKLPPSNGDDNNKCTRLKSCTSRHKSHRRVPQPSCRMVLPAWRLCAVQRPRRCVPSVLSSCKSRPGWHTMLGAKRFLTRRQNLLARAALLQSPPIYQLIDQARQARDSLEQVRLLQQVTAMIRASQ